MSNEPRLKTQYHNPHLLLTGSLAALGGLLIYALITWVVVIISHWK